MSDPFPESSEPEVDADLQRALAAFGDDALSLLDDDDELFEELVQQAHLNALPPNPVQQLLERYGNRMDEDTALAYAGSIALACSQAVGAPRRTGTRFIVFAVGDRHFGLPLECVTEIARCGKMTRLPRTPDWLRGVVDLRGQLYSVTDFARLLQLTDCDRQPFEKIIVMHSPRHRSSTALVVHKILGIRELEKTADGVTDGNDRLASLVTGTARDNQAEVILLDPDRLLGCSELTQYMN